MKIRVTRVFLSGFLSGAVLVFFLSAFNNGPATTNSHLHRQRLSSASRRGLTILCWILTKKSNFGNRTKYVKETWAKRCNVTLFFSSVYDQDIPTIKVDIPEGREFLAKKTLTILQYVHKHYYDKADWFFKADDDTYAIVENLRHFLSLQDTHAPFYYGRVFRFPGNADYNSGGAGYVLGKEALRRISIYSRENSVCTEGSEEDLMVGRCLGHLGVRVGVATDNLGRPIFNWANPYQIIHGPWASWATNGTYSKQGTAALSPVTATFHYAGKFLMRSSEFFLYNLSVHGYHRPTTTTIPEL